MIILRQHRNQGGNFMKNEKEMKASGLRKPSKIIRDHKASDKKKRLFIGVMLKKIEQEFFSSCIQKVFVQDARYIEPQSYHVTLIPPFYDTDLEGIVSRLAPVASLFHPFDLTFSLLSSGPSKKNPRLVWAQADSSKVFSQMKEKIKEALSSQVDFSQDKKQREVIPHVTLLRFSRNVQSRPVVEDNLFYKLQVREFHLIESVLTQFGAHYHTLQTFSFD